MRPHRNPSWIGGLSPFHLLDHFRVGLLDEHSDPSEHLAPPSTRLLFSRIDQLRGRVFPLSFLRALLHGYCRFIGYSTFDQSKSSCGFVMKSTERNTR